MKSAWVPSVINGTSGVVYGEEVLRLYEMNNDHRVRAPFGSVCVRVRCVRCVRV